MRSRAGSVGTTPPGPTSGSARGSEHGVGSGISGPRALGLAALAGLALIPLPFGDYALFIGQYVLVYTILGLSIVIVTGYAGMISLMPYSFAGIGALATGLAVSSWGWPFWIAVPFAALATLPVSLVVGLASVRLKGLYLAIATLTAGYAMGETLFRSPATTGGEGGWLVQRPVLGPIDLSSDAAYYAVCVVVAGVLLWMVEGLRTSRMGRAMLAVRDNELEAQAIGINVYRTRIEAFVLGGILAGVGGAFLAGVLVSVTPAAFRSPTVETTSILLLTLVAVGGMHRAVGALLGALGVVTQQQIFQGAEFFYAFFGIYSAVVLIMFLRFRPGGLVEVGKLQMALIRRRPAYGTAISVGVIATNVGVLYLFLKLS